MQDRKVPITSPTRNNSIITPARFETTLNHAQNFVPAQTSQATKICYIWIFTQQAEHYTGKQLPSSSSTRKCRLGPLSNLPDKSAHMPDSQSIVAAQIKFERFSRCCRRLQKVPQPDQGHPKPGTCLYLHISPGTLSAP